MQGSRPGRPLAEDIVRAQGDTGLHRRDPKLQILASGFQIFESLLYHRRHTSGVNDNAETIRSQGFEGFDLIRPGRDGRGRTQLAGQGQTLSLLLHHHHLRSATVT